MIPAFSKKEALRFGWTTLKAHWKFLAGLTLVIALINYVPGAVLNYLSEQQMLPLWAIFGLGLLIWMIQLLLALGRVRIFLNVVDGKTAKFRMLLGERGLLVKYMVGSFIYGVLVVFASFLLLIPGLYVATRLQFWTFELVDRGLGPWASIKASWAATKGSVVNLFLFNMLMALVSVLGMLALGVGLLASYPVTLLANTWVYRKLVPNPS